MDEAQLLSVTMNGMEFTFKATKEMIELMIRFLACLKRNGISAADFGVGIARKGSDIATKFKYHKNSGKTGRKNLNLKSGLNVKCFEISDSQYQFIKKNAKKYGVLFSTLPDFKWDGKKHIVIPTEQTRLFNDMLKGYYDKIYSQALNQHKKEDDGRAAEKAADEVDKEKKNVREETPEDYINSQDLDSKIIPYERFLEKLTEGMPEEEKNKLIEELSNIGQMPVTDSEKKTGESLGENELDLKTQEHINEISNAVRNNSMMDNINNPEMTYIEISRNRIIPDEKTPNHVLVMDNVAGKEKNSVSVPEDNFMKFSEDSYLMVAHRDMSFVAEDGETYSAGNLKKIFNNKDENERVVYSQQFSELFTKRHDENLSDDKVSRITPEKIAGPKEAVKLPNAGKAIPFKRR